MANGNPTINDFIRILVAIKQLAIRDPDSAEKKAVSLANFVRQNLPLTNDPVSGTKRAELLEEIRLQIRDIRIGRSSQLPPTNLPHTTPPGTTNVVPLRPKK